VVACQTSHPLPHRLPPNLSEFSRGNPYLARLAMLFEKVLRKRKHRKFPEKPRQVRQHWLPRTRGPAHINQSGFP